LQEFTGAHDLTGINQIAANVNGDNYINSLDALHALKRVVALTNTYTAGDWVYENVTAIV